MNILKKSAKDKIKGKTLNKGSDLMIKKIAWNTFKNTVDINTFLELKQIENIEKRIENITDNKIINVENIKINNNKIDEL